MTEYTKINTKLSDSQLKSIKKAVKNDNDVTLRLGYKNIADEDAPHELFLTTSDLIKKRD